jgi:hypothetical protein
MSLLEAIEPYSLNRSVLQGLDKNIWNVLLYAGVGVLPSTGLFSREKAINAQMAATEHMKRGVCF